MEMSDKSIDVLEGQEDFFDRGIDINVCLESDDGDDIQRFVDLPMNRLSSTLGNDVPAPCNEFQVSEKSALPLLEQYHRNFYKNNFIYFGYKKQCSYFGNVAEKCKPKASSATVSEARSNRAYGPHFTDDHFNNHDFFPHNPPACFDGSNSDVTFPPPRVNERTRSSPMQDQRQTFQQNQLHKSMTPHPTCPARQVSCQGQVKKSDHIRRPMNAFMVWSRLERKKLARSMPHVRNPDLSKILGDRWKNMTAQERMPFVKEAERIKLLHSATFPEYKYKPKKKKSRLNLKKGEIGDSLDLMSIHSADACERETQKDQILKFNSEMENFLKHLEGRSSLSCNDMAGSFGDEILESIAQEKKKNLENLSSSMEPNYLTRGGAASLNRSFPSNLESCESSASMERGDKTSEHFHPMQRNFAPNRFRSLDDSIQHLTSVRDLVASLEENSLGLQQDSLTQLMNINDDEDLYNAPRSSSCYNASPSGTFENNHQSTSTGCEYSNGCIHSQFWAPNDGLWTLLELPRAGESLDSKTPRCCEDKRNMTLKDLVRSGELVSKKRCLLMSHCFDMCAVDDWVRFIEEIPACCVDENNSNGELSSVKDLKDGGEDPTPEGCRQGLFQFTVYPEADRLPTTESNSTQSVKVIKGEEAIKGRSSRVFGKNISRSVSKDSGVDELLTNYSSTSSRRSSVESLDSTSIDDDNCRHMEPNVQHPFNGSKFSESIVTESEKSSDLEVAIQPSTDAFLTNYSIFDYSSCPYYKSPNNAT